MVHGVFPQKAFEPYRVRLPNIGNHLSLFWFTPNAGVDSKLTNLDPQVLCRSPLQPLNWTAISSSQKKVTIADLLSGDFLLNALVTVLVQLS